MPTFLDLGLLKHVEIIFPFILVWVIVYSILQWRKVLGDNQSLNSIVAFVVALMTLFAPPVILIIKYMTPWFAMLLIFAVFMILFFRFFGVSEDAVANIFLKSEYSVVASYWILVMSLLVLGLAIGQVFFSGTSVYVGEGEAVSPAESLITAISGEDSADISVASGRGDVNFAATIFHPKVLGMLFVLVIASLAIKLLAGDVIMPK